MKLRGRRKQVFEPVGDMTYPPTWQDVTEKHGRLFVVYDEEHGTEPKYAVVSSRTPALAATYADIAARGKLKHNSPTLVVKAVK